MIRANLFPVLKPLVYLTLVSNLFVTASVCLQLINYNKLCPYRHCILNRFQSPPCLSGV